MNLAMQIDDFNRRLKAVEDKIDRCLDVLEMLVEFEELDEDEDIDFGDGYMEDDEEWVDPDRPY